MPRRSEDFETLVDMQSSEPCALPPDVETAPIRNASESPDSVLEAREMIGRYVLIGELGRGGMGRVLRAYDPQLGREVALKEVRRNRLSSDYKLRLASEARAMAKLSHPNVVAVYDVEPWGDDELVLVMEYVRGTTLRDWLSDTSRDWQTILRYFVGAGRGLAAAHRAGLLHRDFKPTNVLVGDDGAVKVTDFGLAKFDSSDASDSFSNTDPSQGPASPDGSLTETGMVLGTPRYMAPEQHCASELSPAVDQYAFCVALWEALARKYPFAGSSVDHKCVQPDPAIAGVPRTIAEILSRGLAPAPERRWASIDELLLQLEKAANPPPRSLWKSAGVVIALGATAGAWSLWASDRTERCSGANEALAGVWDEEVRTRMHATMSKATVDFASRVARRAEESLDAYTRQWKESFIAACEATTVRGEQSESMLDLRMSCLHRSKLRLDAVVGVLTTADTEVLTRAHDLLAALEPIERCSDLEALRSDVPQPAEADARHVDEVRGTLARAAALIDAGDNEASLKLSECLYRAS